MVEERSDEVLVRLVRNGDTRAFDELLLRYLRAALAVALEYARDRDEAEDLAQEAFIRALRQLDRFDERLLFRPWFFTILRNLGRNAAQRSSRSFHTTSIEDLPAAHGGDVAYNSEIRTVVERELGNMTELQASCFRLCDIEGFSAPEVADMLGIGDATVRTHAHRARIKLRETLTRLGYGMA